MARPSGRREGRLKLGSLVAFTGWAAVTYVTFAFAEGIFHNYYVSYLAPALAALVGIGFALARDAGRVGRVIAAAALAGTAVLQVVLAGRIDSYGWLAAVVPVVLGLAVVAWLASAVLRNRPWLVSSALGLGLAGALVAPAIWSVTGVRTAQNPTFPDARPAVEGAAGFGPGGGGGGMPGGFTGSLSTDEIAWLRGQQTTEKWLAVSSSMQANQAIIDGESVMAMGGFSGSDPTMTPEKLADLVAAATCASLPTAEEGSAKARVRSARSSSTPAPSCRRPRGVTTRREASTTARGSRCGPAGGQRAEAGFR